MSQGHPKVFYAHSGAPSQMVEVVEKENAMAKGHNLAKGFGVQARKLERISRSLMAWEMPPLNLVVDRRW